MYMVQRRERLKKQLLQAQLENVNLETHFHLHGTPTVAAHTANFSTLQDRRFLLQDRSSLLQDRSSSELESSSDVEDEDMEVPPLRQTRWV